MLSKSLAVAFILLFVGVGIQPAFAIISDTSENEDNCQLCAKKVSKSQLTFSKKLLNRLEKYDTQLLKLSELNPEFEEKYQEAYNKFIIIKEMINEFKPDSLDSNNIFLCSFLLILLVSSLLILCILYPIYWKFEYNILINSLMTLILIPFDHIFDYVIFLGEAKNCWEIPWPPW